MVMVDPNYVDPTLTADQWQPLYYGSHYERLSVIKRDVDPNNVFSFPQSIAVAGCVAICHLILPSHARTTQV